MTVFVNEIYTRETVVEMVQNLTDRNTYSVEERADVISCINKLPLAWRKMLALIAFGFTPTEIIQQLGMKRATYYTHRAKVFTTLVALLNGES